ncbi:YjcZ family sporulation protein [Bacillus licheniformis]|nr:YjcZ family sporulation protein [Bacillus licheniformis]
MFKTKFKKTIGIGHFALIVVLFILLIIIGASWFGGGYGGY